MTTRFFNTLILSTAALFMTGCYTQLAVVERPVPVYVRADSDRMDERAEEMEYFDEDSYSAGYDDAVTDLLFRDYRRKPVFESSEYELGYRDGFSDASWSFYDSRFRYRYNSYYWDPFYYDSYWAFYVSWQWHRPFNWYGYYGYNPYHFYNYPPYYHGYGWMGYGYYGPRHHHTWIVYQDYDRPASNVHYGPRASGVSRDHQLTERGTVVRTGDRAVENSARTSGVTRGATTTRERGTVTENSRTNTRTTGVRAPSTNRGSTGTTARPSTTGSSRPNVRSTPPPDRGNSSGGVRSSGSRPSSGSSSSGTRPRPDNRRNDNDDALSAAGSSAVPRSTTTTRQRGTVTESGRASTPTAGVRAPSTSRGTAGISVVPRYSDPQPVRQVPEVRTRAAVQYTTRSAVVTGSAPDRNSPSDRGSYNSGNRPATTIGLNNDTGRIETRSTISNRNLRSTGSTPANAGNGNSGTKSVTPAKPTSVSTPSVSTPGRATTTTRSAATSPSRPSTRSSSRGNQ